MFLCSLSLVGCWAVCGAAAIPAGSLGKELLGGWEFAGRTCSLLSIHTWQCSNQSSWRSCCLTGTSSFQLLCTRHKPGRLSSQSWLKAASAKMCFLSAVEAGQGGLVVHGQQHLSALLQAVKARQAVLAICLISSTWKWCPSSPSII